MSRETEIPFEETISVNTVLQNHTANFSFLERDSTHEPKQSQWQKTDLSCMNKLYLQLLKAINNFIYFYIFISITPVMEAQGAQQYFF